MTKYVKTAVISACVIAVIVLSGLVLASFRHADLIGEGTVALDLAAHVKADLRKYISVHGTTPAGIRQIENEEWKRWLDAVGRNNIIYIRENDNCMILITLRDRNYILIISDGVTIKQFERLPFTERRQQP